MSMTPDEIRKLADRAKNNCITERELDAIVSALRHYADSLEKRDRVEAIIEAGYSAIHELECLNNFSIPHAFRQAVAEYRKDNK